MNQTVQRITSTQANSEHSCPNCEYEKSTRGRPVVKADAIVCLDCGTSWKEINPASTIVRQIENASDAKSKTLEELRKLARNGSDDSFEFGTEPAISPSQQATGNMSGVMSLSFGLIAILFCSIIGGSYWLSETSSSAVPKSTVLAVSNVQLREQIGRDGKKVITVKGTVQNASNRSKALPPIAIILRKKDGGEIVRWRYTPPKPMINAGVKTRFVSSIQYDTPVIAYAEAVFE